MLKTPLRAKICTVSLCALLVGCVTSKQAEDRHAEGAITFHMIVVDEYKIIEHNRALDIIRSKTKDLNRDQDIDLGALGQRIAAGGDGNDRIRAGSRVKVLMYGGPGDDELVGSREADLLVGEPGKDRLHSGDGRDLLVIDEFDDFDGGPGEDRAVYSGMANLDLNITDHNVEIFNSGAGDDFIRTELSHEAAIHGGPGSDRLYGSWGDDWLVGGKGRDFLEGGYGNDTYFYGRGDGRDTITDFSFNRRTDKVYDVYSDGSKRNYREKVVRLKEHAGLDRILFGKGVVPSDLLIRFDGGDLLVALKETSKQSTSFKELSDQIRLSNWNDGCDLLEFFEFQSGVTIDLVKLIRRNKVSQSEKPFDFASLGSYGAYDFDKTAEPTTCNPREETISLKEIDPPEDAK